MKHSGRGLTVHAHPARRPARKLRILVVEQHPDMRLGLEVFLASLGHRPHFAGTMQDALAVAGANDTFDLLLSGVHLPDGDGWSLPGLLEQSGHRPPHAIALLGFASVTDVARSRASGFRAHLVKPGAPGELEAALTEVAALPGRQTAPPRLETNTSVY